MANATIIFASMNATRNIRQIGTVSIKSSSTNVGSVCDFACPHIDVASHCAASQRKLRGINGKCANRIFASIKP
jgi:hypothetical protein